MVNRPSGGARSQKWERSDYDFYREEPWVAEAIFDAIDFGERDQLNLIYDPCCGTGNILDVAKSRGHPTVGGDIVDRHPRHRFNRGNILSNQCIPTAPPGRSISVVTNPPFSYEDGIAEKIIRRVLESVPVYRAVFILPIAYLSSSSRWAFFARDIRPSHVFIYSQRPTMPPGNLIETMASPFTGGMSDYCAVAYTGPKHKWRTECRWLEPRTK